MVDFIKKMYARYKELVNYAVFGVLTTIINYIAFWFFSSVVVLSDASTLPANIVAWIISCTFAFITNRIWVFDSNETTKKGIIREAVSFYVSRLATLGVESLIMFVFADVLKFNKFIIKIVANVIVIILNFVLSKLVVFRKKKN
ncbi:MAG: GtrA family protein [Saccharofermentans sp.]|nr:GtrA family protein [Saccharofermentans sp.]